MCMCAHRHMNTCKDQQGKWEGIPSWLENGVCKDSAALNSCGERSVYVNMGCFPRLLQPYEVN